MSAQKVSVTASHTPYSTPDTPNTAHLPRAARRAQKRLLALYAEKRSWRAVADHVGQDKGLLRRVALGKQKAPPAVVKALYPTQIKRRRDWFAWPVAELAALVRQAVSL